jgi:MFS family permease
MDSRRIIRTYLGIGATTTLAQSLIWGVNTLFLLDVGLDIFEIMVVNAAFTVSQMFFEVPTGVVADTLGRRASYLLSVGIILLSTLLYVWFGSIGAGPVPFALASVILGVGFTFYTGAVDAWMVDALGAVGYEGKLDPIFARYGMTFGVFMLVGTISGGFLGQIGLWVPYVARAAVLVPAFLLGLLLMRDLGFRGRPLRLATFGGETRRIARAGITFGLRDRVVRFVMFASLVQGLFLMYGFYSWQRYFLDLLGRDLVWVTGVIAGLVGLTQICGNALVGPLARRTADRGAILMVVVAASTVAVVGAALVQEFWVAVPLYLVSCLAWGVYVPVKQAWINDRIPSSERATIISLDALFGDAGNTAGQLGLGYVSTAVSIPAAWLIGGLAQALGLPLLGAARRAQAEGEARREGAGPPGEMSTGTGSSLAGEPASVASSVAAGPTLGCVCETGFEPCCAPAAGVDRERAA